MEKFLQVGGNRTGADISPEDTKEMVQGAEQYSPKARDGNAALAEIEGQYIHEAVSVGSMPAPSTMKGNVKTLTNKLAGRNPEVLLNKLGERLAFERSGVRLYECFIRKCEALNGGSIAPLPIDELLEIRDEEEQHFLMLQECIETLGADPTAQTPDADVSGVAASGLMKVLTDPRTSISQCLQALLTIELTDNAAWELLITLSEDMKLDEMTALFEQALNEEVSHLERVQEWYNTAVTIQVQKSNDISH
jgi:ferritin-like metal-binding protein YciE